MGAGDERKPGIRIGIDPRGRGRPLPQPVPPGVIAQQWLDSLGRAPTGEEVVEFAEGYTSQTDDERRPAAGGEASGARAREAPGWIERDEAPERELNGPVPPRQAVLKLLMVAMAEASEPRTVPARLLEATTDGLLRLLWERGLLVADEEAWPDVHYLRSSMREVAELLSEVVAHELQHAGACVDCRQRIGEARDFATRTLAETEDPPMVRVVPQPETPDLVSRMADARDALRTVRGMVASSPEEAERAVAAALRWLDEGIGEGMVQRELYGALRRLVGGERHVCTCGDCETEAYMNECRFEKALRSLVGVEEGS